MKSNIEQIDKRLCVSCGICKGICPKECILMSFNSMGKYVPRVDAAICTKCGLCLEVCPACNTELESLYNFMEQDIPKDMVIGNWLQCFNGKVQNNELRKKCTSGGIITSLIDNLLSMGTYESAFVVNDYHCCHHVKLDLIKKNSSLSAAPQSRYVPVSHEKVIKHIRSHINEKVIIVGVPCAITGIIKSIKALKLERDNYLLLGLFCACYLNYYSFKYFEYYFGKKIDEVFWRDKFENKYWYGSFKVVLSNGVIKRETPLVRAYCKKKMKLERCLYCYDLLNVFSDISFGDNNTKTRDGDSGSMIVRTIKGDAALKAIEKNIILEKISVDEVAKSQKSEERKRNIKKAQIFEKNNGIKIYLNIPKISYTKADEGNWKKESDNLYGWNYKHKLFVFALINKIKIMRLKIFGKDAVNKIKEYD